MADDTGLLLLEASDSDSCFRVTQVNEGHDSLLLFGQICLSKETVVVADGSTFVNNAKTLKTSDVGSINESLTLRV